MTKYEITKGSLADIMQKETVTLAESFLTCDAVILFDVSTSMFNTDNTGSPRFDRGIKELKDLQELLPGRIAVIQFSDYPEFLPGGVPIMIGGGTNLTAALKFVKAADVPDMRFILISDGEPNDTVTALRIAEQFQNKIDTIFIGSESDPYGKDFLKKLAEHSGGQPLVSAAENIKDNIKQLLLCERN